MFKPREIRIRLAHQDAETSASEERQPIIAPTDLKIAVDVMKKAALFIGGVYLLGKVVDAGCEIAVHKATVK